MDAGEVCVDGENEVLVFETGALLFIGPDTLSAGSVYVFIVTVSSQDGRTASANATVNAQPSTTLPLSMTFQSLPDTSTVLLRALTEGTVTNTTFSWSTDSFNLSDPTILLSTATTYPTLALSYTSLPAGLTYALTVVAQTETANGSATVTLAVPHPPRGGSCSVSPPSGIAMTTSFVLACQNWVDGYGGNEALRYVFSYVLDGMEMTLGDARYTPTMTAQLPATTDDELEIVVRILDANAYFTKATFNVTVQIPVRSPYLLFSSISTVFVLLF
jgi:hypothetical protein